MKQPVRSLDYARDKQVQGERGFAPLIIIVIILVIGAGVGGFLVLREKKTPFTENEKTSQQKESSEDMKNPIETIPSPAQSIQSPTPKIQPELKPKSDVSSTPKQTQKYGTQTTQNGDTWKNPLPPAPINLALPIVVEDIDVINGLLSPYGLIRKSGDGGIGHGGIDFPLVKGSSIYAVTNGTIIKNNIEDSGGGKTVDVLIVPGEFQGEGWIFKYDHIALEGGLAVGSNVQKGQKIGTNAFEQRGNNHIGLEYQVNNFTIARAKICWVDLLEPTARQQLENKFNQIKKNQTFLESWQTANAEGYYQYRGLLDKIKYTDGPQLCYPLGTDARTPFL